MQKKIRIIICVFGGLVVPSFSAPQKGRQFDDEAVVIENDAVGGGLLGGGGGQTGPGPSLLGSVDNMFKAVKNFDKYRCIERMVCEYMQEDGDVASALLSGGGLGGGGLGGGSGGGSGFGLGSISNLLTSPSTSSSSVDTRFQSPHSSHHSGFHHHPNDFHHSPHHPPHHSHHAPPPSPSFMDQLSGFLFGQRRRREGRRLFRRQTSNIQGNLIRLAQATGMDSMNVFPYVRAALIGHATRRQQPVDVRRGGTCGSLYRDCPTRSDEVLNYLNNHNGGFFNNVQPSVEDEVGPILSAIVSEAVSDNINTSPSEASPLFESADSLITSALLSNVGSYLTGGAGASSSSSPSTAASTAGSGAGSSIFGGLGEAGAAIGQTIANMFG